VVLDAEINAFRKVILLVFMEEL